MVTMTINGITVQCEAHEVAAVSAALAGAATAKPRASLVGTTRPGSAADLWRNTDATKKATILRTAIRDLFAADPTHVSRFSVGFLDPAKPVGLMFRDFVKNGEVPLTDEELVKLADASVERVGFNSSTVATLVRRYNASARAATVKPIIADAAKSAEPERKRSK